MLEPRSKGGRRPLPLFCHLPSSQARTSATLSLQIHSAAPLLPSQTLHFPKLGPAQSPQMIGFFPGHLSVPIQWDQGTLYLTPPRC